MPQYSVDIFVQETSSSVPVHFAGGDISTQGIYIDHTSWVALLWEPALVTPESHHFLLLAVPVKAVSAKLRPGQKLCN